MGLYFIKLQKFPCNVGSPIYSPQLYLLSVSNLLVVTSTMVIQKFRGVYVADNSRWGFTTSVLLEPKSSLSYLFSLVAVRQSGQVFGTFIVGFIMVDAVIQTPSAW